MPRQGLKDNTVRGYTEIQNPFKKYRIDFLFFGGIAAFIVVLLFVVTWISYNISSRTLVQNISYYQEALLNELNKQLVAQLQSVEQISLALSRNGEVQDFLTLKGDEYTRYSKKNEIDTLLANITYSTTMIQSIELYMNNPVNPGRTAPVMFGDLEIVKQESWYPALQNADFAWVGEHMIDSGQGQISVVSFGRKIYSLSGQYKGLLNVNIKASSIQNILKGKSDGSNRLLLDSGGRPITTVGDSIEAEQIQGYLENIRSERGYTRIQSPNSHIGNNEDNLMVWSKFFNSDWMLVELTPWRQITKGSIETAKTLFLVGLAAVFVVLFFTLLLSRQFMKPIRILLQSMSQFSLDRTTTKLPEDYKNEFGALFKGYSRLMDRIAELYQSLEEHYRRQKAAEIQALQAMINPHFLYNTLDQLNWMAIEAGQDKISNVLEMMGRMFRLGLSNGESFIPIADELQHIECYIEIQKIRLGEEVLFILDVPDGVKRLYVPKLTLQPFVENAIIHGLHGRDRGMIQIQAEEREEALMFTISDNGVGMRKDRKDNNSRKTGGYGIRNVKERLAAYFGSDYAIDMASEEGQGTQVTIRLPKIEKKQQLEDVHVENRNHR